MKHFGKHYRVWRQFWLAVFVRSKRILRLCLRMTKKERKAVTMRPTLRHRERMRVISFGLAFADAPEILQLRLRMTAICLPGVLRR